MKKIFTLLVTTCFLLISNVGSAQWRCAHDEKMETLKASSPAQAAIFEQTKRSIREYIAAHPAARTPNGTQATVTIPVVVHVMHTGGAVGTIYNPSDANIIGAINYLNQFFAGTYPGMEAPVEGGPIVNTEIQFALAQRTPGCGATNGIDRVNLSGDATYVANGVNNNNTTGIDELTLKNYSRWNTADYYNVWVVNRIDGADGTMGQFVAGYAYQPGAPANLDGTIMLATQMFAGNQVLPHEIGHAFDLDHPFHPSTINLTSDCPPNSSCTTQGDNVCDTDPVTQNRNSMGQNDFSCRTGTNSCTGTPYTRNTESNMMSYTNCYTLFTNGQKARMQASLSLPSRASLTTSLGAIPCGTTINFSQGTVSTSESTSGTTVSCRTYNDFTYQLSIGSGASQTATATLTFGGTATKGVDYDVTTNGNFTTQSNTATFTAGSTTPVTVTLRVYDDANVESSETIILGMTLNNGGGNATIGTTNPSLTITVADNDFAPAATSSAVSTIGTLQYLFNDGPFNANHTSQKMQTLYTANELTTAGVVMGNINSLQLFINSKGTTGSFSNFTIKMAHTSSAFLYDAGTFNLANSLTTVFTASSFSTAAGWNNFTFTTPFAWNGTSNLVVEYCYNSVTGTGADQLSGFDGVGVNSGANSQSTFVFQNGINCSVSFSIISLYGSAFKPQVRLGVAAAGTGIETTANATKSEHIGVGSDDYFYSASNNLMARMRNVTQSLGCVSTTLTSTGNTWTTFSGSSQRSAKAFTITPTTNGGTVSYTISLYLTNAELGGKAPSSVVIAKSSAATVGTATINNTIYGTTAHTTLGTNHVFTANFTGLSTFFLVDNTILPINLLSFNASLDRNIAKLSWKTSQETNNIGFDIEKSADGVNFENIGFVAGAVNSSTERNYSFDDPNLQAIQYYRLKQKNSDGTFTFSEIKKVSKANGNKWISYINNPFNSTLTIALNQQLSERIQVSLLNDQGAIVFDKNIIVNGIQITISDLPNLAQGIYFIRFKLNDGIEVKKLIKD